ncbi:MAG: hypothetical protein ACT4P5_05620 [Armatimonadota bacterium]
MSSSRARFYAATRYEDFVTTELVSHIDRRYRTLAAPDHRGVNGMSIRHEHVEFDDDHSSINYRYVESLRRLCEALAGPHGG